MPEGSPVPGFPAMMLRYVLRRLVYLAAILALLTVLPRAVNVDGAAYWPASPDDAGDSSEAGYWPSWCNGSSGMGTAFLRAHLATGDPAHR